MRIIKRAISFIAKALKLEKEGDFLTADSYLKNSFNDMFGLDIDIVLISDNDTLKSLLGNNHGEILATCEFLIALGDMEKNNGNFNNFLKYTNKAEEILAFNYKEDIEIYKLMLSRVKEKLSSFST